MDTGATKHTSGRKKLFPKKGVSEYKPNIKVEVASGVLMNVILKRLDSSPCPISAEYFDIS